MGEESPVPAGHEPDNRPVLVTSALLGNPPYVLDPQDVPDLLHPFSSGLGNKIGQVDDETVVKYGTTVTLAEAEAMDYVSKHTSVKCPKVVGAYILSGTGYILMSIEHGTSLSLFWDTASEDDRETVIGQLQRYVKEMQSLKGDYVGGFNRNPCRAGEFEWDFAQCNHVYGPYANEYEFNQGILDALARASPVPLSQDLESRGYNMRYATEQLVHSLRGHDIVFTHGDLHTGNIIVKEDLSVVILDWDTAGFYPSYWEWYKATWMGVFKPSFIRQVERYIPPFWIEANIMRQMYDKILG